MEKKHYIVGAVTLIIVGVGAFVGGAFYGVHRGGAKPAAFGEQDGLRAGRNGGGEGMMFNRAQGGGDARARGGTQMMSRFVGGEVLSNDGTSITVKLKDGGSRIVFVTPTTKIERNVESTAAEVLAGKAVMVNGEANPDGSFVATTIQVR